MSGAESDRMLADSVKAAGNVILVADASYDAEVENLALPDTGYPLDVPGIYELRGVLPPITVLADAASGLGHNRFVLDPDGPLRHLIPFVRTHHRVVPSLGVSAALRVAGIKPQDVRLDGTSLRFGDRVMPLSWRHVRAEDGSVTLSLGPDRLSRTGAAERSQEPHLSDLLLLRPALFGGADPREAAAEDRSGDVPRQDRVRRHDRDRPVRRVRDAVLERQDARRPGPRRGGRRDPVQPIHPPGRRRRSRRHGDRRRAGHWPGRDDAAGVVGDGGHGGLRGGAVVDRHRVVQRRLLAEPVAARARFVGRAVRRRRVPGTSSRDARSGR